MAQDGYDVEDMNWGNIKRHPRYVSVKNVFSVDCQYTLSRPLDARCAGCRWNSAAPGADSLGPLTARAQVGNTVYEVGVDARLVIEQAQRAGAAPTKRHDP
jgi:hypothetical protein